MVIGGYSCRGIGGGIGRGYLVLSDMEGLAYEGERVW